MQMYFHLHLEMIEQSETALGKGLVKAKVSGIAPRLVIKFAFADLAPALD